MEVELKIDSYEDRQRLILSLANSGYKVWAKEIPHEDGMYLHTRILTYFEYKKGENDGEGMMVQRYEPSDLEIIGMRRDDDGDYVDYSEYAALEQRCRELEAENAELRKRLQTGGLDN